jgi:nucleoid DNA-binding protein
MPTEERIALKLSERKKRGSRVPKTANRIKIKRKIPNSRFLKR